MQMSHCVHQQIALWRADQIELSWKLLIVKLQQPNTQTPLMKIERKFPILGRSAFAKRNRATASRLNSTSGCSYTCDSDNLSLSSSLKHM